MSCTYFYAISLNPQWVTLLLEHDASGESRFSYLTWDNLIPIPCVLYPRESGDPLPALRLCHRSENAYRGPATKVPHSRFAFSFYLSFLPSACHAMANLVAAMTFVTPYFCHLKILGEILRLPSHLKNRSSKVDHFPKISVALKISAKNACLSDKAENIFRTKLKMSDTNFVIRQWLSNLVMRHIFNVNIKKCIKLKMSEGKRVL